MRALDKLQKFFLEETKSKNFRGRTPFGPFLDYDPAPPPGNAIGQYHRLQTPLEYSKSRSRFLGYTLAILKTTAIWSILEKLTPKK